MRRLVEQLLALSRVEPGHFREQAELVDVVAMAREVIAELASTPFGRTHAMELCATEGLVPVRGWSAAIEILLRNLIDNALRYSPANTEVCIRLEQRHHRLALLVEDGGPGIEDDAHQRVLQRFHRELGTGVEGSGLGLSIVSQVVALHGASLQMDRSPELGGLRVSVVFPASEEAEAMR